MGYEKSHDHVASK